MSEKRQTPLKKAEGLGSAHDGVHHWWHQRITALAAIPLILWLACSVMSSVVGASYEEFTTWLSAPHNTILMILTIVTIFYHAALGTQVIVEDYFTGWMKWWGIMKTKYYFAIAAVICIFAVLKVSFAG